MKLHDVEIDEARLAEYCREKGIRELLCFGSITREDFHDGSDVDVIVEFDPDAKPSLWGFAGVELDLGLLFGRPAHLHTRSMIHPYVRREIEAGAQRIYETE